MIDKRTKTNIRNEIQGNIVNKIQKYDNIVLQWATGVGKTLAALKAMQSVGGTWYIVCSEIAHIKTWEDEIKKHKIKCDNCDIQIFCYASLKKYVNTKANIILDECHHAISELRQTYFSEIESQKRIFLSATLPKTTYVEVVNLFTNNSIYREKIGISKAIELGILPEPLVKVIMCRLDNTYKSWVYVKSKGKKDIKSGEPRPKYSSSYRGRWDVIKMLKGQPRYELHISCTEQEYYDLCNEDIKYYKKMLYSQKWMQFMLLNTATKRKRFLAEAKTKYLDSLVDKIKDDNLRHVVFTGSIKQANLFKNVIHSKQDRKYIRSTIDRFNKLKIDNLVCVQMLRESVNLRNIDIGVITQLDSKELSFVQMLGRCFRSETPILYVLCMKDTRDEAYLNTALKEIDEKYIVYEHVK